MSTEKTVPLPPTARLSTEATIPRPEGARQRLVLLRTTADCDHLPVAASYRPSDDLSEWQREFAPGRTLRPGTSLPGVWWWTMDEPLSEGTDYERFGTMMPPDASEG